MSAVSPSGRLRHVLLTAAILAGIGWGYGLITSSWLEVDRHRWTPGVRQRSERAPRQRPEESVAGLFPDDSWVQEPQFTFRDGSRSLYFNRFEDDARGDGLPALDGTRQSMRISPVALVWKNGKPHEAPIVVTADHAQVSLSERIRLNGSRGQTSVRIVSGMLGQHVTITGPKNLKISGREFFVSETDMRLWSREPVEFRWEGHTGTADRGVDIQLLSDSPDERGLTSVTGIGLITLNGPVLCHLRFPAERHGQDVHLDVRAASHFEFELQDNRGTFYGLTNRPYEKKHQVLVTRLTDTEPDRLLCPELTVEFHPEIDPDTGMARDRRLRLGRIIAVGQKKRLVAFHAAAHNLIAQMGRLTYEVSARQLDLYGLASSATSGMRLNESDLVSVRQRDPESGTDRILLVPHLRLVHSDNSTVERVECRGPGRIRSRSTQTATVRWNQRFDIQRDRNGQMHRLSIRGGGTLSLWDDAEMRLQARSVDLTLRTPSEADEQNAAADGETNGSGLLSLNLEQARPETLMAEGDVLIRSSWADGELSERLIVRFREAASADAVGEDGAAAAAGDENADRTAASSGHSTFFGEDMAADVTYDPDRSLMTWTSVRLTGREARVEHQGDAPDEHYTARGSRFVGTNEPGQPSLIRIWGSPATISSAAGHASGLRIDLNRTSGTAEIEDNGELEIVFDQDMNGRPIPPVPMKILWSDGMKLQGKTARFTGNARMLLNGVRYSVEDEQTHNTTIRSPELLVRFTDKLRLDGSVPAAPAAETVDRPQIDVVHFVGRTAIHQESFLDEELQSVTDGVVVDLKIHPETGHMTALGSGWIESTFPVSESDRGLRPESTVSVQANVPVRLDREFSGYNYVRATFVGHMEGNFSERHVSLHNSVLLSMVPVKGLREKTDIRQIPAQDMPDNSGLLRANHVYVEAVRTEDGQSFHMKAEQNAVVETRDFSGDADVITYDSAKQQYYLSASEGRRIKAWARISRNGTFQQVSGTHARYNARTGDFGGEFDGSRL